MKCDVPDCDNEARGRHISRKFGTVTTLCIGHHYAMHRLERGQDRGMPIDTLRKALGEKQWNKLMERWKLRMGDDGYVHAIPREVKEKVVFT